MNHLFQDLKSRAWDYADRSSRDGDGQFGSLFASQLVKLVIAECSMVVSDEDGVKIKSHFGIDCDEE